MAGPVGALLGLLALALAAGALAGVPEETLRTAGKLVISPLWFLLPFLVLTAVVKPIARTVDRFGPAPLAVAAATVVLAADLGYGWLPTTLFAAWAVPFVLGVALAQGRLRGRKTGWALLTAGAAAVVVLVFVAGYPASAVGVPGAGRSNLDPPSLAAVALAVAQAGAVLLLLPRLRRLGTRRPVRAVNDAALPIYLWHQATMISVTVAGAWLAGHLPGLLTAPDGYAWAAARLAWLPVFAAALLLVVRVASRRPMPGRPARPIRTVADQPSGQCHVDAGRGIESATVRVPGRRLEVIAVRDSDPPSRSRAAVRSR
ncbi:acyltransferase family protein [Asanoa siamensis]|uniref:acyltransferase family protein n=1 Tax=Asanoa siamensis TaxID=926357 RepID=UPI001942A11B|nr:acyltransferase family protein [Asanoa siamensis]